MPRRAGISTAMLRPCGWPGTSRARWVHSRSPPRPPTWPAPCSCCRRKKSWDRVHPPQSTRRKGAAVARSRGSKVGIGLLVLLLIVLGVLVIVDRVAAGEAEKQIAQQSRKQLTARDVSTPSDPKVSIGGFPFLTQVLAGKYDKITISIAQPKVNNVQLDKLDVVANTVRADAQSFLKGTGDVVADKITGT